MTAVRWVVSSGDYSDYRVLCVCDSKRRAQRVVQLYNADGDNYDAARVETLPYVSADPVKVRIYSMQETLWDDGTTSDRREHVRTEWPFRPLFEDETLPSSWRWVRAPMHGDKGGRLEVRGTDERRVRRVFSDKRAQLRADDAFRLRREVSGRSRPASAGDPGDVS